MSFFGGNSGNTGSTASGASVASVVTNGPAQEGGLAEGDVITSLGGKTITTANDLTTAISQYHPGDKVSIGWTDGSGQTHTATVSSPRVRRSRPDGPATATAKSGRRPPRSEPPSSRSGALVVQRCRSLQDGDRVASTAALSTQIKPHPTLTSVPAAAGT